jgi:dihydropyrimidinase
MIHHFGVNEGRITLNRMVELLATNPAKLFGLYPRKGSVAVGSDADLVIFDPNREVTISAKTHHSKADYSLYEGTTVRGAPDVVLLRGNVLVENDELVAAPGIGQFVKRGRRRLEGSAPGAANRRRMSLLVRLQLLVPSALAVGAIAVSVYVTH